MKQQLVPNGTLDLLTSGELKEALGHHFDQRQRELYRGMKLLRMPITRLTATAATGTIGNPGSGGAPPGPEQGYIWRVQRIMVASGSLVDTAKYVLYSGSDVTATDPAHLMDAIIGGATPGQNVNVAFRPGNKSEWLFPGEQVYATLAGATAQTVYTMTGIVAEVPAEMIGKIL